MVPLRTCVKLLTKLSGMPRWVAITPPKSSITPPLGQNNGTFADFVYEKGDGCLKGGRFDIEKAVILRTC